MKAYSTDLRERVVAACDAGDATREQIAARFSVSVPWIRKLLRQRRETGSIEPKPRGGGRPPPSTPRPPAASARRSGPTTMPPWRSSPARPAWPAAPRPSTGRWPGWGSRAKKVAAGGRAGPPRAEGRAGGLARGVRRGRPVPPGLRRRDGREHGDGPHPRPGPQRRAGRRPGAARPLEDRHPDRRGPARRRARSACLAFDGATDSAASRPMSSAAWCRPCGPATSW